MIQLSRSARRTQSKPFWLQLGALFCLLIFLFGAIGQVTHDHSPINLHHGHDLQAASDSADLCPLCVSMHSAHAAAMQTAPHAGALLAIQNQLAAGIARRLRWSLCLAGRPPPAAMQIV